MLELIAYRTEGITRKSFQKGQEIKDTMIISCQLNNYNKIKLLRGSLWGSIDIIKKLLKKDSNAIDFSCPCVTKIIV